jgi:predicted N-acyltransferase
VFGQDGYKLGENFFQSPYIRLEENWEEFLTKLGKKFRSNLKNSIRKIDNQGISLSMVGVKEDPENAAQKVFEIERHTWKQAKGTAITSRAETEAFYRDVMKSAWQEGALYLALAEKDGLPIAYDLNWAKNDTVYSLKMGYNESFRNLGVGKVLFAYTIKRSFEDGFKYHELMGIDEAFKLEWTGYYRQHSRLHLYHKGIRSGWFYLYNFKIKKLKELAKIRGRQCKR